VCGLRSRGGAGGGGGGLERSSAPHPSRATPRSRAFGSARLTTSWAGPTASQPPEPPPAPPRLLELARRECF